MGGPTGARTGLLVLTLSESVLEEEKEARELRLPSGESKEKASDTHRLARFCLGVLAGDLTMVRGSAELKYVSWITSLSFLTHVCLASRVLARRIICVEVSTMLLTLPSLTPVLAVPTANLHSSPSVCSVTDSSEVTRRGITHLLAEHKVQIKQKNVTIAHFSDQLPLIPDLKEHVAILITGTPEVESY
ncbi:hypothetical protein E2C01_016988 [Portunus trituberculatus]|uniref:Uncharacterized protein n=1 Tax=Portunus trituberculatus TaxID=210409 RepID=A0A5B7DQM6_PORTR|nr:hypothetical protein [Portunus trituberculatus]